MQAVAQPFRPDLGPAGHLRADLPQAGGPQAQIVCGGCRTLLMYPQGAQNVRCARCGHITAVPPVGGSDMAQLVCNNQMCRTVLMYPRGASQVQCSVCQAISCASAANSIGHLICRGCYMTLMYAHGAESVKCAVCNSVTPVTAAAGLLRPAEANPLPQLQLQQALQQQLVQQQLQQQSIPQQQPQQPQPAHSQAEAPPAAKTVVVENPPSVDAQGNEHQNIAVGVQQAAGNPFNTAK